MSRILFVNGNLRGHFNPTYSIVKELVTLGEEVWYFASDMFKAELEEAGAHFISTGERIDEFNRNFKPAGNHPFYTLLEYKVKYDRAVIPILLEQINGMSFDLLVYDSYLGAGSFLPGILKIPSVCSTTTFALSRLPLPEEQLAEGFHPQLNEVYHVLKEQCNLWKVSTPNIHKYFSAPGDLTLVYTAREFNPAGESFDNSYLFTGPSIAERTEPVSFLWEKLNGKKLVYISMGTINTALIDFYQNCMEAFKNTEFQIIMSIGRKTDMTNLGEIPNNFIVRNYVPQLEILKHTSLFISHGGLNSINEAIYHAVPAVVIPLANDQYITAAQISKLGLGVTLDYNAALPDTLRNLAEKILTEPSYKENSLKYSALFQQTGGYQKAAAAIRQLGGKNGNQK